MDDYEVRPISPNDREFTGSLTAYTEMIEETIFQAMKIPHHLLEGSSESSSGTSGLKLVWPHWDAMNMAQRMTAQHVERQAKQAWERTSHLIVEAFFEKAMYGKTGLVSVVRELRDREWSKYIARQFRGRMGVRFADLMEGARRN